VANYLQARSDEEGRTAVVNVTARNEPAEA
jgi:hypothetical protein